MPYELGLPAHLESQRWKVKVFDKELGEEPHVTIVFKTRWWRWALRSRDFMDTSTDPKDVPKEIIKHLVKEENYRDMCIGWNSVHPNNPVDVPPEAEEEQDEE
jgi:hypothetical protein